MAVIRERRTIFLKSVYLLMAGGTVTLVMAVISGGDGSFAALSAVIGFMTIISFVFVTTNEGREIAVSLIAFWVGVKMWNSGGDAIIFSPFIMFFSVIFFIWKIVEALELESGSTSTGPAITTYTTAAPEGPCVSASSTIETADQVILEQLAKIADKITLDYQLEEALNIERDRHVGIKLNISEAIAVLPKSDWFMLAGLVDHQESTYFKDEKLSALVEKVLTEIFRENDLPDLGTMKKQWSLFLT